MVHSLFSLFFCLVFVAVTHNTDSHIHVTSCPTTTITPIHPPTNHANKPPVAKSISTGMRLGVLLPITCRGQTCASADSADVACEMAERLCMLAASMTSEVTDIVLLVGIDHDDAHLLQHRGQLTSALHAALPAAAVVEIVIFSPDHPELTGLGPGALCAMWGILAEAAVNQFGCKLTVLLGNSARISNDTHLLPIAHDCQHAGVNSPQFTWDVWVYLLGCACCQCSRLLMPVCLPRGLESLAPSLGNCK